MNERRTDILEITTVKWSIMVKHNTSTKQWWS